jgi:hypothetical protein
VASLTLSLLCSSPRFHLDPRSLDGPSVDRVDTGGLFPLSAIGALALLGLCKRSRLLLGASSRLGLPTGGLEGLPLELRRLGLRLHTLVLHTGELLQREHDR